VRLALVNELEIVVIGSVINDLTGFGDSSLEYLEQKSKEIHVALKDKRIAILAPFLENKWKKQDIINNTKKYGISLAQTWTCWNNDDFHCGICPACLSRKNAYLLSNAKDETNYNEG